MTSEEIMKLTPEELRLEIARAKGIKCRISDGNWDFLCGERLRREYAEAGDPIGTFSYPDGHEYEDLLPDWPADIGAAWELVGEALKQGVLCAVENSYCSTGSIKTGEVLAEWVNYSADFVTFDDMDKKTEFCAADDTAPLAICRAYLMWKAAQ